MSWFALFITITLLGVPSGALASPMDVATLWVVQPPGEIVAFDLADFSRVGGVKIPPVAFEDPSRLAINGHGQFLVQLDEAHLWVWDDSTARILPVDPDTRRSSAPSEAAAPHRQWFLGSTRNTLYALAVESRRADLAHGDSMTTRVFIEETDFAQRPRHRSLAYESAPCQTTWPLDATLEPCPEPEMWSSGGVVKGCFLLSYWDQAPHAGPVAEDEIPPKGSFHRKFYRRNSMSWGASEVDGWSEDALLDIRAERSGWILASADGGCCGWQNDSSNQTTYLSSDTGVVLFDEWSQFHNQNYDVSFFTDNARIAPDGKHVAFTILATEGVASELRVSSDGHPDSLELESIRHSLADLPIVEACESRAGPVPLQRLTHAELVGWSSDSEIIVVENHQLVGFDLATKHRRPTGISVRSAADAVVVRR